MWIMMLGCLTYFFPHWCGLKGHSVVGYPAAVSDLGRSSISSVVGQSSLARKHGSVGKISQQIWRCGNDAQARGVDG